MNFYSKLSFATISSCLLMAVPVIAEAQSSSALDELRTIYQQHTPENFDDGGEVSHYVWKNFISFFPHAAISRKSEVRELTKSQQDDVANYQLENNDSAESFNDYINLNPTIDSVIILNDGDIVYEAYQNMEPYERHLGWSITKVIVSTGLAALEHQGRVDVEKPIENYLPQLNGTAWQGTSVRNIVNMASGIACLDSDGYQNTESCIYRYEESLGLTAPVNPPQSTLAALQNMRRHKPAGEKYEYVSADTFVTGMLIESITGKPLWLALQDLIWNQIGAEADAMLMISPNGTPATHGGISARLRDIARFGEVFFDPEIANVIGSDHLQDLRSDNGIAFDAERLQRLNSRFSGDTPQHAAWQWDMIWPDGGMFKGGYSGQGIYVDPERSVVAVWFGTAELDGDEHDLLPVIRELSQALF